MSRSRWKTVQEITADALQLPPAARPSFLDSSCGHDPELRREIERSLALIGDASARPALERATVSGRGAEIGTRIGSFFLTRVIAAGRASVVYEARRARSRKKVALKLMRRPLDDDDGPRFRYEAERLVRLRHSGIAQWLEFGSYALTPREIVPYIALEHVEDPIALLDFARGGGLALRERIRLFVRVLEAVQVAHERGLIHGALEPSHLLVDPRGDVKVIGFCSARALGSQSAQLAALAYASPQKLAGEPADTRSDVFSLGVVLYELLAGSRPWNLEDKSPHVVAQTLANLPPSRPSSLRPELAGDLDWILTKAIEPDRERRYASLSELAAELQRHLADEPVLAAVPTPYGKARKFVRRHPLAAGALAATGVAILAGLAVFATDASKALRAQDSALAREAQAQRNAELAGDEARKLLRLADAERLRELEARAETLWPAWPANAAAYRTWLAEAQALIARHDEHVAALTELRARAKSPAGAQAGWTLATPEEQWRHDALASLVERLEEFRDRDANGPRDVERRLADALAIEERSLLREDVAARWDEARASIADAAQCPMYGGLELAPQIGLVPLGRDRRSGLWEFADLATGTEPVRDTLSGELLLEPDSAVVLVLLPGGEFRMGSQPDPTQPNFDPWSKPDEQPVHELALAPFFLSKFELTRGQWRALDGRASGDDPDALHPIERIALGEALAMLSHSGLTLPTEAQWEYAARGNTTSVWWTGDERDSLRGAVDLAQDVGDLGFDPLRTSDSAGTIAGPTAVGTFRANGLGMHDVLGNVAEWCCDDATPYFAKARAGDGLREGSTGGNGVARGGSFAAGALDARCAARTALPRGTSEATLGVRPARAIAR